MRSYWTDGAEAGPAYDDLIAAALAGELSALEQLLRAIQDGIFNLALKFLWNPDDAADATQEILLRITTRLDSFRGESAFPTWAYRVAVNYLLDAKAKRDRQNEREVASTQVSFRMIERELRSGSREPEFTDQIELEMLRDQVRMACLHAMLQCLEPDSRLAFVLGMIFEVSGEEGGYILNISASAYRKRLSRARASMAEFTGANCGLVNRSASCRCENRIDFSLREGRLDGYLEMADRLQRSGAALDLEQRYGSEVQWLAETARAFRESGAYLAATATQNNAAAATASTKNEDRQRGDFARQLRRVFEERQLRLLQDDAN